MPLYKEWKSEHLHLAIWKIEEPLSFFENALQFKSDRLQEKRQLEHLAARFLLKFMDDEFPFDQIRISENGKPFLQDNNLHFSITHSFPYIAVALDKQQSIGLDLQVFQPKIIRLQSKFLSLDEQSLSQNSIEKITLLWAAKEAGYKWYGKGGLDFIKNMPIKSLEIQNEQAHLLMDFQNEELAKQLIMNGGIE